MRNFSKEISNVSSEYIVTFEYDWYSGIKDIFADPSSLTSICFCKMFFGHEYYQTFKLDILNRTDLTTYEKWRIDVEFKE